MPELYLSRLTSPLRSRNTQRLLGDCHAMHRLVMSGFSDLDSETARKDLGVLYRVETRRTHGDATVLVQSTAAPRWTPEAREIVVEGPTALDALLGRIVLGARFRFRLRANPTRRVHPRATQGPDPSEEAKWAGKRVAVRDEQARLCWLKRKGEAAGFALLAARIDPGLESESDAYEGFSLARVDPAGRVAGRPSDSPRPSERLRLTFETCLFEGVLTVTDPDALRGAVAAGIGPGKAFGCGLLSLAPV